MGIDLVAYESERLAPSDSTICSCASHAAAGVLRLLSRCACPTLGPWCHACSRCETHHDAETCGTPQWRPTLPGATPGRASTRAGRPKRPTGLTPIQRQVLAFVIERVRGGVSPSIREIAEHLGLNAHASARRHVEALIAAGYLERIPGVHRGLRVLRQASD